MVDGVCLQFQGRGIGVRRDDFIRKIVQAPDGKGNKTAPVAFLVMLAEDTSGKHIYADAGAAVQSIQFAAWERGIGCCWLGSFKPEKVAELLNLKDPAKIIYLIAVGYPAENPVTEDIDADGNPAYYLDDNDTLHVPKFTVDAITEWM